MKRVSGVKLEKAVSDAAVATKRLLEELSRNREALLLDKGPTIDVVIRDALVELAATEDAANEHFERFRPVDGKPLKSEESDADWSRCCRRRDEAIARLLEIGRNMRASLTSTETQGRSNGQ